MILTRRTPGKKVDFEYREIKKPMLDRKEKYLIQKEEEIERKFS